MTARVPIAWLQLAHEPRRLVAALAGITFAVVLMLVQLGLEQALLRSAGFHLSPMRCDLTMVSPQYDAMLNFKSFPERRLYQALAVEGVASVEPVYTGQAAWKNPWTMRERNMFLIGFRPRPGIFNIPGLDEKVDLLRHGDRVLFDQYSRPEYGPVRQEMEAGRPVVSEIAGKRVELAGLFGIGTSFGIDGTLMMSDNTFFRVVSYRKRQSVNIGLIRTKPGFDPIEVRERIIAALPKDVLVFTQEGLIDREKYYWATTTPIGFVFKLGLSMGIFVGCIVVYQILYTGINDHLAEYATLKAMGYRDGYLFRIVIEQSVILSVLGFIPGMAVSQVVYWATNMATLLPLELTPQAVTVVYVLTLLMCIFSGALAMRKLNSADPAEIF